MKWIERDKLNKTGLILALCQDNTGIYNQLMTLIVNKNSKKDFYINGTLGASHRIYPDVVKAAIYLDDICGDEIIKQFCEV
jgi:hypothetical protein